MEVVGYFAELKRANEAVDKLKNMGFKAYVDINDHYIEDRNVRTNLPGTETSVSLSGLILESDSHDIAIDKAPLNASSPMVSGYGKFEEVADVNCQVITDIEEKDAENVKQTIREMGGELQSYNIRVPQINNEGEIKTRNQTNKRNIKIF